jgi:hypothetical protein
VSIGIVESKVNRESVDLASPGRISSNEMDSRACEPLTVGKRGKEGARK